MIKSRNDREGLRRYDQAEARRKHVRLVRRFLDVKPFSAQGKTGAAFLDALFIVGDDSRRVSPGYDLKQDPAKPTVHGMRDLLARFDQSGLKL